MSFENDGFGDDNLQLIDFSEEDDYLIAHPYRDSLEDLRLSVTFDNVNEWINHVQSESVDQRRRSFLRKSLAWDNAFFTSAGVLNPEELFMINKGFKKAESNRKSPTTPKDGKRSKAATKIGGTTCSQSNALSCKKMDICSQNKVKSFRAPKIQRPNLQGANGMTTDHQIKQDKVSSLPKIFSSRQTNNNAAIEGSDSAKTENKTRKAGTAQDLTVSKRSRSGDFPSLVKSTSFTSPKTEKNSKLDRSYESSSSASSDNLSVKRKVNPKHMKLVNSPSSVHFPLSSTCSSSTSPASSIDGWLSESLSSTTITHQNTITVLDFQTVGSKFISQNATRSSTGTGPFSGGFKRKIKASRLRMPSPKIGFFDEEPIFSRSMQDHFVGQSHSPNENELNKFLSSNQSPYVTTSNRLKVGSSSSKLKPTSKEILKLNLDGRRQKDDRRSFQAEKENVCSYEEQVYGLNKQLEAIVLERDVLEVKCQYSVHATASEPTIPCSRTPLAKKKFGK